MTGDIKIDGIKIRILENKDSLYDIIVNSRNIKVAFANTNLLMCARRSLLLRQILEQFLVVNDGIGVDFAKIILDGTRFPENLNGTDFLPYFLSRCPPKRLFLYGASREVVKLAAHEISRNFPKHTVVGFQDGFSSDVEGDDLPTRISNLRVDILLVALGNPKQEVWLAKNFSRTCCDVGFGVGAFFDFTANKVPRAPKTLRKLRLEWLYRLAREPRRLMRRYTLDFIVFLFGVFLQRLRM